MAWQCFCGLLCSWQTFLRGILAPSSPNSSANEEMVAEVSRSLSASFALPGRTTRMVFIPAAWAAVASVRGPTHIYLVTAFCNGMYDAKHVKRMLCMYLFVYTSIAQRCWYIDVIYQTACTSAFVKTSPVAGHSQGPTQDRNYGNQQWIIHLKPGKQLIILGT